MADVIPTKSKKPDVSSFEKPSLAKAPVEKPAFEKPAFEKPLPKVELPWVEAPAAFRDIAQKSIVQAKDNYEKIKSAADEATSYFESTYASASKGMTDYGLKLIETARANTNATFDFTSELLGTRSLSEAIEVSTAHARKQFDSLQAQSKELAALAQKVVVDTTEPLKQGITKVVRRVA
jgi:phasin